MALSGSERLIKIHFVHLRQLFIYYEQPASLNKQLTPSSLSQLYIAKTIHPAHQQIFDLQLMSNNLLINSIHIH
ncbi:hypothetical protein WB56_11965 [Vibrio cholerae O1 biovar El Tor]|nr:hypothetical protein WB56_11965 [Vibrio cholerae O1 biovar El Tor]